MTASKIGFSEGTGLNIASYSFTEGSETKHMERIAPGAGVLPSGWSYTSVTANGLVSGLSCSTIGKGRIIVMAKAVTGNTDFFGFRLIYKDGAGEVIGTSPLIQPTFTEHVDGTDRFATVSAFANDCCASSVELYVVSRPTSNQVSVAVVAV
jgi:hypothetical protein